MTHVLAEVLMSEVRIRPAPLTKVYLWCLGLVLGLVGGVLVWFGTNLWHLAVGAPLVLIAGWLLREAKNGG